MSLVASVFMAWLLSLENRLIYAPTRKLVATPADHGLDYRRLELHAEDGVQLMAWELPYRDDAPWLIYLHGNGENVSRYLSPAAELHGLGVNILMLEYRGYGESEGVPSEAGFYRDAAAAYRYLLSHNVAPERIVIYGFSLGTGVAVELASRVPVGGLVVEAGYTSLPEVAQATYRIAPTVLMRNLFDSKAKIGQVNTPTLFIHARDDRVVPFAHGQTLFELAAGPKQFVEISGGHTAMLTRPPEKACAALSSFLERHLSHQDLHRPAADATKAARRQPLAAD